MPNPSRRAFLGTSAASGLLGLTPEIAFGSQANSALEIGIIGCGRRGVFIGNFFKEYTGARVVAVADPLPDRAESLRSELKLTSAPRVYTGLDGFRELAASKLDAIIIESPPCFHPEHAAAAVAAGKHVYLAKPIAVDVPGCQSVAESARRAQGRLSFMVDFQTRARPVFQEAARRVHAGEIGTPVLGHVYYHAEEPQQQVRAGDSVLHARLRNWNMDRAISGDMIVEQNIHVIDVANWYLQGHPIEASGTCGRTPGSRQGNMQDFYIVNFAYPNNVRVDFSGMRFAKGFRDLCIRIYGTRGTVDSHYVGTVSIGGEHPWKGTGPQPDATRDGALTNVRDFVESIRTARFINNAGDAVQSNLTCILGRTSAWHKRPVTWDEMMRMGEKLEAGVKA